jgi:hypothetical protein
MSRKLIVYAIVGLLGLLLVSGCGSSTDAIRPLDQYRQALIMYRLDHGDYPTTLVPDYFAKLLVDKSGKPYLDLEEVKNNHFIPGTFNYVYLPADTTRGVKSSFRISVQYFDRSLHCKPNECVVNLEATPDGIREISRNPR